MKSDIIHEHLTLIEYDGAKEMNLHSYCSSHDLALDIKWLLSDFYNALFQVDGNSLMIKFNNGQNFLLSITETV